MQDSRTLLGSNFGGLLLEQTFCRHCAAFPNKRAQADEHKIARNEGFLALPNLHPLCRCSLLLKSEFSHLRKRSAEKLHFCAFPGVCSISECAEKLQTRFGSALAHLMQCYCWDFGPVFAQEAPKTPKTAFPLCTFVGAHLPPSYIQNFRSTILTLRVATPSGAPRQAPLEWRHDLAILSPEGPRDNTCQLRIGGGGDCRNGFQGPLNGGVLKRGGFPIWTCPLFFVLFCPFSDFPDFSGIFQICPGTLYGFSRFVLLLFPVILTAPTRNSPERVHDTIWTFPEKKWKTPWFLKVFIPALILREAGVAKGPHRPNPTHIPTFPGIPGLALKSRRNSHSIPVNQGMTNAHLSNVHFVLREISALLDPSWGS